MRATIRGCPPSPVSSTSLTLVSEGWSIGAPELVENTRQVEWKGRYSSVIIHTSNTKRYPDRTKKLLGLAGGTPKSVETRNLAKAYRIAGYFRGVYISRTANSILVREKWFHEWRYWTAPPPHKLFFTILIFEDWLCSREIQMPRK